MKNNTENHEYSMYGSSRVGNYSTTHGFVAQNGAMILERVLGKLQYERTNHLGNVLTTITDQKYRVSNVSTDYLYQPIVTSVTDYFPFGMQMPGRTYNLAGKKVRYGFNGQERDYDINQAGNVNTAMFWEYDARQGRRWNLDPISYVGESPYATFRNSPIMFFDINGDKPAKPSINGDEKEGQRTTTTETIESQLGDGTTVQLTQEETWYFHNGSTQGDITYAKDWYNASDYKKILTGTSSNANPSFSLNKRLLASDVFGSKTTVTEKDLSVEELLKLKEIVHKLNQKGKTTIEYADYQTTTGKDQYADVAKNGAAKGYGSSNSELWSKSGDPAYNLKTTLGQAKIVYENGEYYVVDTYDFNDAAKARDGKSFVQKAGGFLGGIWEAGFNSYKQARNVGTYFGSKDGEGIPIKIKIPIFK